MQSSQAAGLVLMPVIVLDARLMHVRMRVRHPVMSVLVLMVDVFVIMRCVRVGVRHAVVPMLVDVRRLVGVRFVGHIAPLIAL